MQLKRWLMSWSVCVGLPTCTGHVPHEVWVMSEWLLSHDNVCTSHYMCLRPWLLCTPPLGPVTPVHPCWHGPSSQFHSRHAVLCRTSVLQMCGPGCGRGGSRESKDTVLQCLAALPLLQNLLVLVKFICRSNPLVLSMIMYVFRTTSWVNRAKLHSWDKKF